MKFNNNINREKTHIIKSISSFTDILFAVVVGFALSKAIEITEITPFIERLKAIFLYCFILIYIFNFWFATKIETNLIKEFEPQSFSLSAGFLGGIFGIIVVGLTYYMLNLIIKMNLKQVFLFFLIYDIILIPSNFFLYISGNQYKNSIFKEFYCNKIRMLIYVILLISMYGVYLLANKGYIWHAIAGVYFITIVSEVFLFKLRSKTIYKLLRE